MGWMIGYRQDGENKIHGTTDLPEEARAWRDLLWERWGPDQIWIRDLDTGEEVDLNGI